MHLNFDTSVGKGAKELERQSRRNRESFLNEEGSTSSDSSNMNHETQSSGRGVTTKGRKSFILQSVEMRERGKKGSRDTHGRHSDVESGGQGVTDASQGTHTITTHPSDENEKENSSRTTRRSRRRRVKLEKANLIESLEQQISVMRHLSSQPSKDHGERVHRSRNSSEDGGAVASSHETTEEEEERESLEVSLRPENMRGPLPSARRASLDSLKEEEEEAESTKMSAVWRSSTGDDDDSEDGEGDDRERSLDVQLNSENMHADPSTRDSSVWEEQRKVVNPLQKGVRDFIPSRTSRLPRNPGVDGGPSIRTRTSRLSRYSSTASMRESVRYSSTT